MKIIYDGRDVSAMLGTVPSSWLLDSSGRQTSLSVGGVDPRTYDLQVGKQITLYETEPRPWWKRLLRIKPKTLTRFAGIITRVEVGWDRWGVTHSFEALSLSDWLASRTVWDDRFTEKVEVGR